MNKSYAIQWINALNELMNMKAEDLPLPGCGICANIECLLPFYSKYEGYEQVARDLSTTWKHFSGNRVYPIPSTNKKYEEAGEAYALYEEGKWRGKQRTLRKSLMQHLINELEIRYVHV